MNANFVLPRGNIVRRGEQVQRENIIDRVWQVFGSMEPMASVRQPVGVGEQAMPLIEEKLAGDTRIQIVASIHKQDSTASNASGESSANATGGCDRDGSAAGGGGRRQVASSPSASGATTVTECYVGQVTHIRNGYPVTTPQPPDPVAPATASRQNQMQQSRHQQTSDSIDKWSPPPATATETVPPPTTSNTETATGTPEQQAKATPTPPGAAVTADGVVKKSSLKKRKPDPLTKQESKGSVMTAVSDGKTAAVKEKKLKKKRRQVRQRTVTIKCNHIDFSSYFRAPQPLPTCPV